jgi:uncharacterized membrane protein YbhN (UPF0104 family)
VESKALRRAVWLALLVALLAWTVRNAPLADIWAELRALDAWQVGGLLLLNSIIIVLMTARWGIILRAEGGRVPFGRLLAYRLAAFGVSYFTPGPQVGGEPLQVMYLRDGQRLSTARAAASVILDKLLEFIANFIFLAAGLVAIARVGIFSASGLPVTGSVIPLGATLALPVVYTGLLVLGFYPLGAVLKTVLPSGAFAGFPRLLLLSERMAGVFTRRHGGAMSLALAISLAGWAGMTLEYWLMAHFLGMQLTGWQSVAGVSIALLSFLLPIPAGLGALEAGQVFALGALGYSPAQALSLTLLIRGRDLFFAGLGLVLASRGAKRTT